MHIEGTEKKAARNRERQGTGRLRWENGKGLNQLKIAEIIDKIKAFHPPIDESRTCDTVKCGNPDQECTGVVVTVYASVEVIQETAKAGANLIVCHEPLFFSHNDTVDWLEGNTVYEEKAKLLEQHGIVVWRNHDHIHGGSPSRVRNHMDLIFYGLMQELGWEQYCIGFDKKPMLYEIPETTGRNLAAELVRKLNLEGARIVGNLDARVHRVFFCEHVSAAQFGNRQPDCEAIQEIEKEGYDALIPFEIVDWTLSEYVRDAAQLGRNKVLIEMGHFNVEELAMKYMLNWLPGLLAEDVPVHFVQSGDSFHYITA